MGSVHPPEWVLQEPCPLLQGRCRGAVTLVQAVVNRVLEVAVTTLLHETKHNNSLSRLKEGKTSNGKTFPAQTIESRIEKF